ncbi:hypothetical protein YB2330_002010 [Saitoella coloradoensis]
MTSSDQKTVGLTPDQLAQFQRDGYLLIPNFLSEEEIEALRARTDTMLNKDFDPSTHPGTQFTTGDDKGEDHVGDQYFLTSGSKVRFFLEPDAIDHTSHKLTRPPSLSINKIGHGLHMLDPTFGSVTINEKTRAIAKGMGYSDPRVLQSMVILKQPEIGGAVPSHMDSTFLYTDPPSAVGFWIALEDCTKTNGCLSFVPGSHQWAAVTKRFVRQGEGTGFEDVEPVTPNRPAIPEMGKVKTGGEFVMGECKAGTLVLIHGSILHKSERNTSPDSRWIYTFHVIEGENVYDKKNWLQPEEGQEFTKLYE